VGRQDVSGSRRDAVQAASQRFVQVILEQVPASTRRTSAVDAVHAAERAACAALEDELAEPVEQAPVFAPEAEALPEPPHEATEGESE
jgi:hypothetical protein